MNEHHHLQARLDRLARVTAAFCLWVPLGAVIVAAIVATITAH